MARTADDTVALLLALGRTPEAVEQLRIVGSRTPSSCLLEAICYSDLKDWNPTVAGCGRSRKGWGRLQLAEKQRWLALRAEALSRMRRTADTLACWREAAIEYPAAAAMFSMQTALHMAELRYIPEAVEALCFMRNPHAEMATAIDHQERRLQTQSCMLPATWESSSPPKSRRDERVLRRCGTAKSVFR